MFGTLRAPPPFLAVHSREEILDLDMDFNRRPETIADEPPKAPPPRPMRLLAVNAYRGPHLYSATPMIRLQLDLGDLEAFPTDRLPGFAAALGERLPGLLGHGCGNRNAGGFAKR